MISNIIDFKSKIIKCETHEEFNLMIKILESNGYIIPFTMNHSIKNLQNTIIVTHTYKKTIVKVTDFTFKILPNAFLSREQLTYKEIALKLFLYGED